MRRFGLGIVSGMVCLSCGGGEVAGPPAVAVVRVSPAADTLLSLGATVQLSAVALDAAGQPIAGKAFAWTSSAPSVATVDAASGLVTAVGNGVVQIAAATDGVTGQAAATVAQDVAGVTVTPGSASLSALDATQAFTAVAKDANNNTVTGVKFLWISSDPSVATVDTNGLARARGAGQTAITAAARGVPGNAVLTVSPSATQLAIAVQPGNTVAGSAVSPALEVEIRDAGGHLVTAARNPVTIALGANPGGATLKGTNTVNANGGVASFSGLVIEKAAAGYTLTVSTAGLTGATSASFDVPPGPASRLAFVPEVGPVDTAGIALGVSVAIEDAFRNVVTTASDTITLSLAVNPAGATLFGTGLSGASSVKRAAAAGVAPLGDVNLHLVGTGYLLQGVGAGLSAASSAFFQVVPAQAARVQIDGYPAAGDANGVFGVPFVGSVRDSFGNVVKAPSVPVTLAILVDPWSGPGAYHTPVLGAATLASDSGLVTFSNVRIGKPSGGSFYQVGLTSPGLASWNSGLVSIQLQAASPLAAGGSHSCVNALRGTGFPAGVFCWGSDSSGQLGAPTGSTVSDSVPAAVQTSLAGYFGTGLTVGGQHTCALTATASAAYCWGDNTQGQLGNGQLGTNSTAPTLVSGGRTYTAIAAGGFHTCAIAAADSAAYCWGRNANGQLGDSTTTPSDVPVLVHGGLKFVSIAAGGAHSCGVTAAGAAYCWGDNSSGQLGDSSTTQRVVPRLVVQGAGRSFLVIKSGGQHTCAVADTVGNTPMYCWGSNSDGQLGIGSIGGTRTFPAKVQGGLGFDNIDMDIAAGDRHTCAADDARTGVYCWGDNQYGQIGNNGAPTDVSQPLQVNVGVSVPGWLGIAAGASHTCARVQGGSPSVYCWGRNDRGQLGDGSTTDRPIPVQIVR